MLTLSRSTIRRVVLSLMVVLTTIFSTPSHAQTTATPPVAKKYFVLLCQYNSEEPYAAAQKGQLKKLFAAYPDVRLAFLDAQGNPAQYLGVVRTAITMRPHLLIITPHDTAALAPMLKKGLGIGVPIMCLGSRVPEDSCTTCIRGDNVAIGRMAGEWMVKKLTEKNGADKGVVVELGGVASETDQERQAGLHEALDPHPQIKVVYHPKAKEQEGEAKEPVAKVLAQSPQIDCVFGHNDALAAGAYQVAKDQGREKQMLFVGIEGLNGPAGGIKKVLDGILAATFVDPLGAERAVEVANKMLREPAFKPEKQYVIESMAITPQNAGKVYAP